MISKYMYLEFLLVISDYFKTLDKRTLLYEWFIPFLLGVFCFVPSLLYNTDFLYNIISKSIDFVATLLGFTLATLTLLLSSDKLNATKQYITNTKIGGKQISLYRKIIISYTYLIIIEALLCVTFFLCAIFPYVYIPIPAKILNSIYIVILLHILLVTIRTITELYFVLSKEQTSSNNK